MSATLLCEILFDRFLRFFTGKQTINSTKFKLSQQEFLKVKRKLQLQFRKIIKTLFKRLVKFYKVIVGVSLRRFKHKNNDSIGKIFTKILNIIFVCTYKNNR